MGWGELSGATTPCPQRTRPRQWPGVALEAPGQRVPLPLPSITRSMVGGPQSHSGKGFRAGSSLGPHKAGSPPPYSRPPREAQSNSGWALEPTSACFPPPQSFSLAHLCDFGPWFSFQIGVFQEVLRGSDSGASLMGSCRPHASHPSLAGPHPGQRGLGLGTESGHPAAPFPV